MSKKEKEKLKHNFWKSFDSDDREWKITVDKLTAGQKKKLPYHDQLINMQSTKIGLLYELFFDLLNKIESKEFINVLAERIKLTKIADMKINNQ